MRRLRQKVELDPNRPIHIQTVRGVGYRLVSADG
jgi:DNA-binding response OmpR family regulator